MVNDYLHAEVVLEEVDALGVVLAGVAVAEAGVDLAPLPGPAGRARARELAHLIMGKFRVNAVRCNYSCLGTVFFRKIRLLFSFFGKYGNSDIAQNTYFAPISQGQFC
jgi:hypothetical protein